MTVEILHDSGDIIWQCGYSMAIEIWQGRYSTWQWRYSMAVEILYENGDMALEIPPHGTGYMAVEILCGSVDLAVEILYCSGDLVVKIPYGNRDNLCMHRLFLLS